MDDLISRQQVIETLNLLSNDFRHSVSMDQFDVGNQYYYGALHDVAHEIRGLPSAQQNRIARETAGKSPDEIYDFLCWLMSDYTMRFTDSRAAVIEWLKEERRTDE